MNASSKFQDSLPISSDALLRLLHDLAIDFELFEHVPLFTVTESKTVQHMFLTNAQGGGHIKNLYLRDHKKRNFLIVAEQDQKIDLKALAKLIGSGRLSFGSAERLMQHLGVRPGAVTPLSMVNGTATGVQIWLDASLKQKRMIYAHPLVNDRTVAMDPENLVKFFAGIGCNVNWIPMDAFVYPSLTSFQAG